MQLLNWFKVKSLTSTMRISSQDHQRAKWASKTAFFLTSKFNFTLQILGAKISSNRWWIPTKWRSNNLNFLRLVVSQQILSRTILRLSSKITRGKALRHCKSISPAVWPLFLLAWFLTVLLPLQLKLLTFKALNLLNKLILRLFLLETKLSPNLLLKTL